MYMYTTGWIQTYPVKIDSFTLNNLGFFRNILYRGITENLKQIYKFTVVIFLRKQFYCVLFYRRAKMYVNTENKRNAMIKTLCRYILQNKKYSTTNSAILVRSNPNFVNE